MLIGRKFTVIPAFSYGFERGGAERTGTRMEGICIYVHPEGRFATLEFDFSKGKLREAFGLEELRG